MEKKQKQLYIPDRVIFTPEALSYPLGQKLWKNFTDQGIPVLQTAGQALHRQIPGQTPQKIYMESKKTLVAGVRSSNRFETCRPSADYQLPLVNSCPGRCQYCYLHTRLGKRPYLRVYVNVEEILNRAVRYISDRMPEITTFEVSASGDPLPTEPYTGTLKRVIEHFAGLDRGRLRLVTKYDNVDGLLRTKHGKHTRIRFSVNLPRVINNWEGGTPSLERRIKAARLLAQAGYPVGFLIAPVFLFQDWRTAYGELIDHLAASLQGWDITDNFTSGGNGEKKPVLTFELVSHRFTPRAREAIKEIFPFTKVPFDEECRSFRLGQFGYGKYLYKSDLLKEMKTFFKERISYKFPGAHLEYIV